MLQMKPLPQKIALPKRLICCYVVVAVVLTAIGGALGGRELCAALAGVSLCGFTAMDALVELRAHPSATRARHVHGYITIAAAVIAAIACMAVLILS